MLALVFCAQTVLAGLPGNSMSSIEFIGYQAINGQHLFQLRFVGLSADKQPGLLKKGDTIGQGEPFVVGDFKEHTSQVDDPKTHAKIWTNDSTLDLINVTNQSKLTLTFRRPADFQFPQ